MKLQVIIFCLVLFGTAVSGFAVSGNNEYCPINPRKGGQTLVPNHDAFSFLLSCPVGKTKWEGPSQDDIYNEWEKLYFEGRPNSHRVSSDTDVFLYETSYTNGVNDVRQAACVNWEHAFIPDAKTSLLVTGSGKPIIVGQDRRFENQDTNSSNTLPFGQWIYSICSDVTCTDVTVPKPFWGRRIGEPLYQDTMAELAYFPFPPDWAYNSPRLGVTLNVQDSPDSFGNPLNPSEIAHAYVTNENDERLLVLLLNGYTVNKVSYTNSEFNNPPNDYFWYLAWCQDEDCETWSVYQLPISYDQTFSNANSVRPAISAVGDVVTIVTRETHDQYDPRILTLRLRSLDVTGPYRLQAFNEIYANLIGANYALTSSAPNNNNPFVDSLLVDEQIYNGIYNDVHPLNFLYGGRGAEYFGVPDYRPSVACVDLEASGVNSDPWCHWTSYWEVLNDYSGISYSDYLGNLEYPTSGTFYDLVYDSCLDTQVLVVSPLDNPNSYATFEVLNDDGSFTGRRTNWLNPYTGYEYLNDINATYPTPSPHGFNSTTLLHQTFPMTGRRFTAIQGANGRPFFSWADLRGHLLDAPNVWGTCAISVEPGFECRTILDSIELGTFGFLRAQYGQTKVLQGPDGLPVLIFWFDHFGGYQNDAIVTTNLQTVPGQVTSKPLIVNCLDAFCDSASISTIAPAQLADIANVGKYEEVNPTVNVDAAFVGDNLVLLLNEGGRFGESTANPIRLWRTNRWASPTGTPCSEQNAGQRAVADDVVYYCTRIQLGSQDAELYVGEYPRPWTRLYEWVRMDWGYGLRNLGAFLGWGANYNDQTFYDIAADKDPWWTDNSESYLQTGHGQQPIQNNN